METRTKIVDFASYRFARDLRLSEARDAAARLSQLPPAPRRDHLSEAATAHRERMLRHLTQPPPR